MKKILSLALVVVMILCFAAISTAASIVLNAPSGLSGIYDRQGTWHAITSGQITLITNGATPVFLDDYLNAGFTLAPQSVGVSVLGCGTTNTCANTLPPSTGLKIAYGQLTPTPTANITMNSFSPTFTSSSSFNCYLTDTNSPPANTQVSAQSPTGITIYGTPSHAINYFCIGQ